MKAALTMEIFGEDDRALVKAWTRVVDLVVPGLGEYTVGKMPVTYWAAEITGFDPKYKYTRKFLRCKKDYSRSNSIGSRGIFAEYTLESGHIYQILQQYSWKRSEKYFCAVSEEGDIAELTEEEVINWLNNTLGLTSSQRQSNE